MELVFENVENVVGFNAEDVAIKSGETKSFKIVTRGIFTSDDPEFYLYSEKLFSVFFNHRGINQDAIFQYLFVIHDDFSANLYINNFDIHIEVRVKKDTKAGEVLMNSDIVDITKVTFPKIEIKKTDRVLYSFKVGWRFGLFFDFTANNKENVYLDISQMETSIGDLRKYLAFYHVYKSLEAEVQFKEMIKEGWFPFIDILSIEYKSLSEAFKRKLNIENDVKNIIDKFDESRIKRITDKWWKKQVFAEKRILIEAGVNAYLQNTQEGFVNSISTLYSQTEGILRKIYHIDTGKADGVKSPELIKHIIDKGKIKTTSDLSLYLPLYFLQYLKDVVFPSFNISSGDIDLSRNTSSHGVADVSQYTKSRSLQLILILDQIYFYV